MNLFQASASFHCLNRCILSSAKESVYEKRINLFKEYADINLALAMARMPRPKNSMPARMHPPNGVEFMNLISFSSPNSSIQSIAPVIHPDDDCGNQISELNQDEE